VSFNGQDIKCSPFELRVHCVSAEQSYLEVPDLGPFPGTSKIEMKIVAVDQDGTPLKQGGDQFTASITVKGQPEVYTQTRTGRKCDYWQSKSWTLVWIRRFALFCFDDFPFAAELTLIVG